MSIRSVCDSFSSHEMKRQPLPLLQTIITLSLYHFEAIRQECKLYYVLVHKGDSTHTQKTLFFYPKFLKLLGNKCDYHISADHMRGA